MPAFDTLLICATPRSGSTLLCRLLAAAGIGRPESWFRAEDRQEYAADWGLPRDALGAHAFSDYLPAALKAARGARGVAAIRLMAETLAEVETDLAALWPEVDETGRLRRAFGRIRALHLTRADLVAQAVSRLRAEQSGLWHSAASWEERQAPMAALGYDRSRIASLVAGLEADARAWSAFFARTGIAPEPVTYEELSADPGATLGRILAALDLPRPDPLPDAETRRLADDVSAEWIARFRDGG